ncbi:hypothetical protein I317_06267 [Kwoniella heveanensis CBS 569]|uniref:MATH domain-containing protein n=1 Tax=Kwoniella heveanensis BCC8398 TaxID=1296120 RepID=A0A1B9H2Q6_9TREE|nr:hypothetical protein I316_00681 [Kwoniella heveanensis BCC8398]OCF39955.1 hypothetical protein I317_06267 [Kwoniella heveanensis CBS 569]
MASVPPPYSSRDHAQVQPGSSSSATVSSGPGATSGPGAPEFQETTSICLEWRLTGLKAMYESTRGEQKSKCIRSAVFGDADNLWEVLWYPNAGTSSQTAGDHVSLYLSCVVSLGRWDGSFDASTGESVASVRSLFHDDRRILYQRNKWTRKGLWWFKFEVRPLPFDSRSVRPEPLAAKDASDHTFAVKTANWGWQAFAKRDALFQHPQVQATDSFMIVCTIQPQPQPPAAAGGGVRKVVPKDLIRSVGAMLDDPLYSDVEFVIPSKGGTGSKPRSIYANKKLLNRCEYFEAMFNGGFKEVEGVYEEDDSDEDIDMLSDSDMDEEDSKPSPSSSRSSISPDLHLTTTTSRTSSARRASTSADRPSNEHLRGAAEDRHRPELPSTGDHVSASDDNAPAVGNISIEHGHAKDDDEDDEGAEQKEKEVQSKKAVESAPPSEKQAPSRVARDTIGPKKTRVVVRDAAWSTWWAVLYWIYTDEIYFAPLTSSFEHQIRSSNSSGPLGSTSGPEDGPKTRAEWISKWMMEHDIDPPPAPSIASSRGFGGSVQDAQDDDEDLTLGPRPVSAKAVYRLADKLDLPALKLRAFQHICGQLTSGNVPAEVFSRFSSTYEDIRKVQIAFFLKHWSEIKKSETMMQIWQQIRHGKHVGFEEVWPLIVGQLDFKPS